MLLRTIRIIWPYDSDESKNYDNDNNNKIWIMKVKKWVLGPGRVEWEKNRQEKSN